MDREALGRDCVYLVTTIFEPAVYYVVSFLVSKQYGNASGRLGNIGYVDRCVARI